MTVKNKQDYMGVAYIVLLLLLTKIRELNFNIQIFLGDWYLILAFNSTKFTRHYFAYPAV